MEIVERRSRMLNLGQSTKYVSIFKVKVYENYVKASLTTGKKSQDETFTNMYWNAKFIGKKAYEKAKELKDKDKIEILKGTIENTYDKENKILWVNVTVFDFNKM